MITWTVLQINAFHFHEGAITRFLTLAMANLTAEERAEGVEVVLVDEYPGVRLSLEISIKMIMFTTNVLRSCSQWI